VDISPEDIKAYKELGYFECARRMKEFHSYSLGCMHCCISPTIPCAAVLDKLAKVEDYIKNNDL